LIEKRLPGYRRTSERGCLGPCRLGALTQNATPCVPPFDREPTVDNRHQPRNFEQVMLAHLDDAYNLARWLMRDAPAAGDAVLEACGAAARSFAAFRGPSHRAWLLGLVREACHARLSHEARDEDRTTPAADPDAQWVHRPDPVAVDGALADLPATWRECVVLRDLHGLSYADMASIIDVPVGTVMTRLTHARRALQCACATGPFATATGGHRACRMTGSAC
jgi:RNA polymerase sigma-70 factor (ECF subfamily)